MHAAIRAFVLICALAGATSLYGQQPINTPHVRPVDLPDCGSPGGPPAREAIAIGRCIPPYQTPVYTKPPDDSVALGSLLEAAGYSSAANTDWLGVAAGNFCRGMEKQLILMQNKAPNFSTLHGPTPHVQPLAGGAATLGSNSSYPWRAVTAGNLDGGPHDEFVAVRKITANGVPDLIVGKISEDCVAPTVVASKTVGNAGNSKWVGVAVGNFDRTGKKKIALLKAEHSNLFLVELDQNTLNIVHRGDLDGNPSSPWRWKALAAGDIDHDGVDELIAVREVSDGRSPTVLVYKWNDSTFVPFATSTFGNNGNSAWTGAAVGDFNADGRKAIVLVKNKHSNFVVLDLPPNATELRKLTSGDLESAAGQSWTGLATTDWLGGDQGANELIAVRRVARPYRTNVFVYGNAFHRIARDTGLDQTRAQWVQHLTPNGSYFTPAISDLKQWIRDTHTTVFNWILGVYQDADATRGRPFTVHDFSGLVNFLVATRAWGVDGKQLRVWATISPPNAAMRSGCMADEPPGSCVFEFCAVPEDTRPTTSFNALDYFKADFTHDYDHLDQTDLLRACRDVVAWAAVLSRLAQEFPHMVAFGIDDASNRLDHVPSTDCREEFQQRQAFGEDCIAAVEAALRANAPWMNFVPTIYYGYRAKKILDEVEFSDKVDWADLPLTLDSMQFFFRNEKDVRHECINNSTACTGTVANAAGEIRDMQQMLPSGRKIQVGVYFVGCDGCGNSDSLKNKPPRIRYSYELVRTAMNLPEVGGVTAYGLQTPPWIPQGPEPPNPETSSYAPCSDGTCAPQCTDFNFLTDTMPPGDAQYQFWMQGTDRYCALQRAFSGKPQWVHHADLTTPGSPPAGDPSAFFDSADGTQQVIFRSTNGHLHELWWTAGPVGQGDLTPQGPAAADDPAAYFLPTDSSAHVIYRSADGHVRELVWVGPNPAARRDLTPSGASAVGRPAVFYDTVDGSQNVIFRSSNGHLHELWWTTGPVGQGDLTPQGPAAADDPAAYFLPTDSSAHVIYRSADGHVRELVWVGPNPAARRDLTPSGASAVGRPAVFYDTVDGSQNVIFRSSNGHLHELWWTTGPVGQGTIIPTDVAPRAASDPSAYFVPATGTSHVIYRSGDGHLHELFWMLGVVTHNDLTQLANAPTAVGVPFAYFNAQSETHHVSYRGGDGHMHELSWRE